jgi:hypothetical protein
VVVVPVTASNEFRVYCEECELEEIVTSQVIAEDMVEAHADEERCTHADWEEIG